MHRQYIPGGTGKTSLAIEITKIIKKKFKTNIHKKKLSRPIR